jgi:hypothetical protein
MSFRGSNIRCSTFYIYFWPIFLLSLVMYPEVPGSRIGIVVCNNDVDGCLFVSDER